MARILIIDDSPTERAVLVQWLTGLGHEALEAADADAGLGMARGHRPSLVLMDVVMPGMNGFEAIRAMRNDPGLSKVPVVIISTKRQPTDFVWGRRQGAQDYLAKPFSKGDLAAAIERLLPT